MKAYADAGERLKAEIESANNTRAGIRTLRTPWRSTTRPATGVKRPAKMKATRTAVDKVPRSTWNSSPNGLRNVPKLYWINGPLLTLSPSVDATTVHHLLFPQGSFKAPLQLSHAC